MILHNDDEVDDDHHIRTANPTYENFNGLLGLITIYCAKDKFKDFTQIKYNCTCLPLKRYIDSWFSEMNFPRLSGEYLSNTFSSSTKGIGGLWNGQVFYIKKSFFGTAYGIKTPPLVWIYTFVFMAKYVHGGYSYYNVTFGTIPEIIRFIHYTLWYPAYYYDSEEDYRSNNKHLVYGS